MKQPYSCWKEVPEGVRWDRKRSPEPNLHVCGEDGIKRVVYNMKEEHAEERSEHREKQREDSERKLRKKKNCIYFKEKLIVIAALIHL